MSNDETIEPCCPMEHPLSFALLGEQCTWTCDVCSAVLPANSFVLKCKHCNWDACYACIPVCIAHRLLPQEDIVFCPRGHGTVSATSDGTGEYCDRCSRDFYESEGMTLCDSCDWACCSDCREEYRKETAELKITPSVVLQSEEEEQQRQQQDVVHQIHLDYELEQIKRSMLGL